MKVTETSLPGVLLVEPKVFGDARGYFFESYHAKRYAEAGIPTPGGGDPSAPVNPRLKQKFITTTWISALIFAPFWIAVHFHWLSLGMFRNFG